MLSIVLEGYFQYSVGMRLCILFEPHYMNIFVLFMISRLPQSFCVNLVILLMYLTMYLKLFWLML